MSPTILPEDDFRPGRLWSLLDMLRIYAHKYIELGGKIEEASNLFDIVAEAKKHGLVTMTSMSLAEKMRLHNLLQEMSNLCGEIGLPVARELIHRAMSDTPQTSREFAILADAVTAELKPKVFLYLPSERSSYVDKTRLNLAVEAQKFPRAVGEIEQALRCYAYGLGTPAVFHAMRAAEIGVQAMATALGVTFSYPIELAEWGKIVGEIEPKINALKAGPRDAQKDADLKFYSEAASQFRHFNNGWRIRVSHARESYSDDQAREVIEHVRSFFETLAERLSEGSYILD